MEFLSKKKLIKRTLWILGIAALISFCVGLYSLIYVHGSKEPINIIGDYVGGVAGAFWTLSGSLLVFMAFILQQDQINDTRQQFSIQSFETSFYNLLNFHNLNVQNMDIEESVGKNCFQLVFSRFKGMMNSSEVSNLDKRIKKCGDELLKQFPLDLPLYLGSIDVIIQHIKDEKSITDKSKYYLILFRQLTHFEIIIIYYMSYSETNLNSFIEEETVSDLFKGVLDSDMYSF